MTDEKLSASVTSHDVHINTKIHFTLGELLSLLDFTLPTHILERIQYNIIQWNRTEYRRVSSECTLTMIELKCSP